MTSRELLKKGPNVPWTKRGWEKLGRSIGFVEWSLSEWPHSVPCSPPPKKSLAMKEQRQQECESEWNCTVNFTLCLRWYTEGLLGQEWKRTRCVVSLVCFEKENATAARMRKVLTLELLLCSRKIYSKCPWENYQPCRVENWLFKVCIGSSVFSCPSTCLFKPEVEL